MLLTSDSGWVVGYTEVSAYSQIA